METVCHTIEEIERAARRLPCVATDNREALTALGFELMYPQCVSGYESHLWVRSVDAGSAPSSGQNTLVIQRAFLGATRGPDEDVRARNRIP